MYKYLLEVTSFLGNLFYKKNKQLEIDFYNYGQSPEDISRYFHDNNFESKDDLVYFDMIYKISVFLRKKVGDCDDHAYAFYQWLKRRNYECYLVGIFKDFKKGHCICIYKTPDVLYNYTTNKDIVKGLSSIRNCIDSVYPEYMYYEILDKHQI